MAADVFLLTVPLAFIGNLSHGHQLQGHSNVANPFSGAAQSPQVGTSNNYDSLNPPPGKGVRYTEVFPLCSNWFA